jgi:hypothetical protein
MCNALSSLNKIDANGDGDAGGGATKSAAIEKMEDLEVMFFVFR